MPLESLAPPASAHALRARLRLPVICAPMFIASTKELVAEQCKAGVVGSFPSLNARPEPELDAWLDFIEADCAAWNAAHPDAPAAPYAVNLIVHPTNPRLEHDLEVIVRRRVPIVITSLNEPSRVVEQVHAYGGLVFHDISTVRHARKAHAAGVDGLIAVCAGAGGHTGSLSAFAFTSEIREFFDGTIVLSGSIGHGNQVLSALAMGCDFAYVGTRFLATHEAGAAEKHKAMIVEAHAADIVTSTAVTGLPANYLRMSFEALGLDPSTLAKRETSSFSFGARGTDPAEAKAWRDIWSAGQGVGTIHEVTSARVAVDRLHAEYVAAQQALQARLAAA